MDLLRVSDLNKKLRCYYCPWCIGGQIWQESLRCPLQWSNHDKFWCPPDVRCLNLTCDTTHGHLMAAHLISARHSHWLDADCLWTNQQRVCMWSAQSLDSWKIHVHWEKELFRPSFRFYTNLYSQMNIYYKRQFQSCILCIFCSY